MRSARPHPVVVLAVVLAVPALVFGVVWRWAGSAAADPVSRPTIEVRLERARVVPADAGRTALSSWRRLPGAVAADGERSLLAEEVAEFGSDLGRLSCVAVSLNGDLVSATNDTESLIPASLQKIVVAAVALDVLGPDHRYETTVAGSLDPDGTVTGDLHLIGGGDPLLSSDWYIGSAFERNGVIHPTRFEELADRVVAAGVRRVEGRVLGDGSRYDDEWFAPGWGPGVAGTSGGPYGALMANDSRVPGTGTIGSDPVLVAVDEFARLLAERGVSVAGGTGSGAAVDGVRVLATIQSEPMTLVVDELLVTSDNNTGEMLVKEIGLAAAGEGSRQAGLAVVESTLARWGIPLEGTSFTDGSGLSLDNRLTCRAMLELLGRYELDESPARSFPVAAETGTLQAYFGQTTLGGRLRGKTGTLGNPPADADPPAVKALAGYVPSEGSMIDYVLILMGPTINAEAEFVPVWNRFAEVLGSYPTGLAVAELGPR